MKFLSDTTGSIRAHNYKFLTVLSQVPSEHSVLLSSDIVRLLIQPIPKIIFLPISLQTVRPVSSIVTERLNYIFIIMVMVAY